MIEYASEDVVKRVRDCEALVEKHPQLKASWDSCMETLNRFEGVVKMYLDFAPYSFLWNHERITGGMIFHGSGEPTFSVTLTPHTGWMLHT